MARKCSAERAAQGIVNFVKTEKNIVIQFDGKESTEQDIMKKVKADALTKGIEEKEIAKIDLYIKPAENQAYYVINQTITGNVEL